MLRRCLRVWLVMLLLMVVMVLRGDQEEERIRRHSRQPEEVEVHHSRHSHLGHGWRRSVTLRRW